MTNWLRLFWEPKRRIAVLRTLDDEQMRAAVAHARAQLEAEGRLEIELDAQREIRERVRSAA
jgi:multidrug resistance efflux pump